MLLTNQRRIKHKPFVYDEFPDNGIPDTNIYYFGMSVGAPVPGFRDWIHTSIAGTSFSMSNSKLAYAAAQPLNVTMWHLSGRRLGYIFTPNQQMGSFLTIISLSDITTLPNNGLQFGREIGIPPTRISAASWSAALQTELTAALAGYTATSMARMTPATAVPVIFASVNNDRYAISFVKIGVNRFVITHISRSDAGRQRSVSRIQGSSPAVAIDVKFDYVLNPKERVTVPHWCFANQSSNDFGIITETKDKSDFLEAPSVNPVGNVNNKWKAHIVQVGTSSYKLTCVDASKSADLVVNGDFDVDADWVKGAGWTIPGGAGAVATVAGGDLTQVGILTLGRWYRVTLAYTRTAGSFIIKLGSAPLHNSATHQINGGPEQVTYVGVCGGSTDLIIDGTGFTGTIDDVVCEELTVPSEHLLLVNAGTPDVFMNTLNVNNTNGINGNNHIGWVFRADTLTNPQNFLLLRMGTNQFMMERWNAGVQTTLFGPTTIVVGSQQQMFRLDGAVLSITQNETTRITPAAGWNVAHASVDSNTYHGLWCPNKYSGFTMAKMFPLGTEGQYNFIEGLIGKYKVLV